MLIHRLPIATSSKCRSPSATLPSSLPLRCPHARWADAAASTSGSRPESPILSRNGPEAFRPTRRPDPAPPSMKNSCGSGRDSALSPQRRGSRPRNRHHRGWTRFTERTGVLKSSLRANGSRQCAPDDRLREASQSRKARWIASSRSLSSSPPKAGPVGSWQ
jgi:hypothetical protein